MYKYFFLYAIVFVASVIITALIERRVVPFLKAKAKQPIYEDGPKWHSAKSGTPTMGGIAFISAICVCIIFSLPFFGKEEALSLLLLTAFAAANAAIGVLDDLTKLRRKRNAGLSPRQKLFFQSFVAAAYLAARRILLVDTTKITFTFGEIDLGLFYYPISVIIILGIVNCANLTDGVDGLASCVSFGVGLSFFYISAYFSEEVALACSSLLGAMIGFLIFNLNPAKIFMGDTGSLFLGALCVGMAFSLKNPILAIAVCGVFVVEGISVILQVLFFKACGRRLFKMAPIHHHLERSGLSENTICIIAIIATVVFSIPAYLLYLP